MVDKDAIPNNDDTAYFDYAWRLLGEWIILLPMLEFFILFTREAANDSVKILFIPPYKKIVSL